MPRPPRGYTTLQRAPHGSNAQAAAWIRHATASAPTRPRPPAQDSITTVDGRAVLPCQRQDEEEEGRGSNQTLGQRTPAGLSIRIQTHAHPPAGGALILQRG